MSRTRLLASLALLAAVAGCKVTGTGDDTRIGHPLAHVTPSAVPTLPAVDQHPNLTEPRPFTPAPTAAGQTPTPWATGGPSAAPGTPAPTGGPTLAPGQTPGPTATPAAGPEATPTPAPTPWPSPLERATEDRPDDEGGFQVHAVYMVPSDKADRGYDTDGTIARSMYAFTDWLQGQTKKQTLRLDRSNGAVDVTYVPIQTTDASLRSYNRRIRDALERELKNRGFTHPKKLYAIYYEGTTAEVCGGAPWPPDLPGTAACIYLQGDIGCDDTGWARTPADMTYREFSMIHEIFHGLGFVPRCAPHQTLSGHTSSTWADLMYSGSQAWQPRVLDDMHELYEHSNAGCLDLSMSAFLTPAKPGAEPPPMWDQSVRVVP